MSAFIELFYLSCFLFLVFRDIFLSLLKIFALTQFDMTPYPRQIPLNPNIALDISKDQGFNACYAAWI